MRTIYGIIDYRGTVINRPSSIQMQAVPITVNVIGTPLTFVPEGEEGGGGGGAACNGTVCTNVCVYVSLII